MNIRNSLVVFFIVCFSLGCSQKGRQTVAPTTKTPQERTESRQNLGEAISTIIIGFVIGFSLGIYIGDGQ